MTIGEALKQIRLQAGLTQTQIAADIITESFYSKVERGVHSIDADTLINLLTAHHLDVIHFFTLIANQKSVAQPHFDLVNKITFAQNRKDIRALDKIASEIQNGGGSEEFYLQFRLQNAYAWVLHSNKMVSSEIKKKVKSLILDENWNRPAYHYLSQAIIFLDIDEAYYLVNSAFNAFKRSEKRDTFSLQFVALIAVNYLNCCYHQKVDKKYTSCAIDFLHSLPIDASIGLNSILGTYYEALFNNDVQTQKMVALILKKSGYLSTIEDTLSKKLLEELK